jgi:uncharacterized protein YdaU (DUF1376 family)
VSQTAPAIPFFGDAYLADTRHLSLEEHGAYLQLMMIAWRIDGCCLPNDDARLARMLGCTAAKWRKLKPTVMAFWTLENGAWTQARLSKERKFVEEKRAKNSASAKAMWEAKALENKGGDECERNSQRNAPPPPPPQEVLSSGDDSASDDAPALRQEHVFEGYQALAAAVGLAVPRDFTPERRQLVRGRITQYSLDDFQAVFAKCRDSPFLSGDRGRTPLTFDWLMKKGNFQKVLEGNYDR